MAINADFPSLSFADANPYLTGAEVGRQSMRDSINFPMDMLSKELANRINAVKAQYEEPHNIADLIKKHLENTHKELENKYYGPNIESEIGLNRANISHIGAETNKLNKMLPGDLIAQQLSNRQKQQETQSPGNFVVSSEWKNTPADTQKALIAQGLVFNPNIQEVTRHFISGGTMGDLAQAAGFDRNDPSTWPPPGQNPSKKTQSMMETAKIARAGIESISDQVAKDAAPYIKTFGGVPTEHIKNVLKNVDDSEAWGRSMGANTIMHDIAIAQSRSGGVMPGISAMKQILGASGQNLDKVPGLAKNPAAYMAANKYIGEYIAKLNDAESKAYQELYRPKNKKTVEAKNLEEFEKQNPPSNKTTDGYSDEDIQFTAKKYNISPEEVLKRLKQRGNK